MRFCESLHCRIAFVLPVLLLIVSDRQVHAQAGLRQTLEAMDKNKNGDIDPDEITPLARPYLERISEARRMSLDRPNDIERLQEAARIYYALQNGVDDKRVRPAGESAVKGFQPEHDEPLIPEFGLAEVKYPYTQDDLDFAQRTLRSHDDNRDGYIDREEAQDEKWTHRNPFDDDLDKDDRLSRMELAQRYARRRLLDDMADELRQKSRRGAGELRRDNDDRDNDRRREGEWWRKAGNSSWLTASMMGRFDINKNGRLETAETATLGLPVGQIDADRNGELTRDELQAFVTRLQDDAGDPGKGIPGWFYELDENQDEQVSMVEFTEEWTEAKVTEFANLDSNGDGVITANEMLQSKAMVGGSYSNRIAEVLPPQRTIISEIEVNEDFLIGDLNVQISITHSHTSALDAYLTGPDGQRIELFTEVGGHDDHFEDTMFDDQSRYPINKARPPFKGTFLPEAAVKRQPSLGSFNGKNVKGVWQLVIRATRSDRFGMLHHWSLFVKPIEQMVGESETEPAADGPQPNAMTSAPAPQPAPPQPSAAKFDPPRERPKIDYESIGRRMEEAVKAGKMTREQVNQAWVRIKAHPKGGSEGKDRDKYERTLEKSEKKGLSREEAMQRYRELMERKRAK